MKSPGVSGIGLGVALAGALLVYTGVRDVTMLDAARSLARGIAPAGPGPRVTQVVFDGTGQPAGTTTPAGYAGGPAETSAGAGPNAAIATAALKYLGVPYLWGGTDPARGLDCSGLVQLAVRQATGETPPRVSLAQSRWSKFRKIGRDQVAAGDVLWWPGHIAIAISNSDVVHAPRPGTVVRTEAIRSAGPAGTTGPSLCLRYAGTAPAPKPATKDDGLRYT